MILFKEEHVAPILDRRKTQTRRTGKTRWKVGAVRQAKRNYLNNSVFAMIRVTAVRQERLGDITEEDARREGADSVEHFMGMYERSYGAWTPNRVVHVIDFELVGDEPGAGGQQPDPISAICPACGTWMSAYLVEIICETVGCSSEDRRGEA